MNKNKEDFTDDQSPNSNINFIEEGKLEEIDNSYKQSQQEQKNNQQALLQQIHSQFHVVQDHFYFKNKPQQIAFIDKGKQITSALSDDHIVKAMVTMAQAKGWQNIKASGNIDFQRKVWMEASKRGIEVYGYTPTQQELEKLDKNRNYISQNVVEKVKHSEHTTDKELPDNKFNRDYNTILQNIVKKISYPAKHGKQASSKEAADDNDTNLTSSSQKNDGIFIGHLLAHGQAKFKYDKNNNDSYYVKFTTDDGEKTIWGIDLKRAISEENIKQGDYITLKFTGKQNVKVEIPVRDEKGKVIDHKWIETKRNRWDVSKSDEVKIVEAVAAKFIDSCVKNSGHREALKEAIEERLLKQEKNTGKVPTVSIYDKEAPSKESIQERFTPKVEHNLEHTR